MRVTLKRLEREVHKMDPALAVDSKELRAGVLLLAGASNGDTSSAALVRFTGYPRDFVRQVVKRANDNGIFTTEGVAGGEWFRKNGALAFWMDVCCALGLMSRVKQ